MKIAELQEITEIQEVLETQESPKNPETPQIPEPYTLILSIITFILIKLFGEPLIGARIFELTESLNKAIEEGVITAEQKVQQIELAKQIYSPTSHVLIVLLGNLFVGFISSILAAVLVRK